jgi:DNA polymerase-3 subunit alpha
MKEVYTFQCGCKFPILEEREPLPLLDFDIRKVRKDCPAVWEMLGKGFTKGVFQLESRLGKTWCQKLKPDNLEHLTALGALLRPGCLQCKDENGISTTEHYCLRKNGEEDVDVFHPSIEEILRPTYGVMCYQEQAMKIAEIVAGFNLQDADVLRKSIGKKLPEEMAKVKIMFLEGVEKTKIITKKEGETLFSQIEKSQRYSFNKSHAYCYAIDGYWSAYCKAHFPVEFFTEYLSSAKEKQKPREEIKYLVAELKAMDLEIFGPQLLDWEDDFWTDGYKIHYGLGNIKNVGKTQINKIFSMRETCKAAGLPIDKMTWFQFLVLITDKVASNSMQNIISTGALSHFGISRTKMLAEYNIWKDLKPQEQEFIRANCAPLNDLVPALERCAPIKSCGGGCSRQTRTQALISAANSLKNSPTSMDDKPNWIVSIEKNLLGTPITFTKIDSCDVSDSNITCKDFLAGKGGGGLFFAVEVEVVKPIKTKKGDAMAFLTVTDSSSASMEMVVFPDVWTACSSLLTDGNTLLVEAYRDKKKNGCIVKNVYQL